MGRIKKNNNNVSLLFASIFSKCSLHFIHCKRARSLSRTDSLCLRNSPFQARFRRPIPNEFTRVHVARKKRKKEKNCIMSDGDAGVIRKDFMIHAENCKTQFFLRLLLMKCTFREESFQLNIQ